MDKDLFDLDDEPQTPEDDQPVVEEDVEPESDTEAEDETPAEEEENAEAAASDDDDDEEKKDDEDEEDDEADSPAEAKTGEKKPEESKPVNVVEQDPYNFDQCLITIAMALMPDDGNPEGRPVMLGVRNHQDEPLMGTCRLSDLMPLPDPVQQLIEQLKADLPVRSERTAKRRKDEEDKRKAALEKSKKKTPGIKPASAKAKKAEAASVNLFEMFDP
jgi:hypothetical protein